MTTIKALDKLREWADRYVHADAMRLADEIEAEIEERYMPLPLDADGVPIRVGDVLESDISGKKRVWMVSADGFAVYGDCSGYNPKAFRHVKPRTLEDVLDEYYEKRGWDEADNCALEANSITKLYADEIRELMGGE